MGDDPFLLSVELFLAVSVQESRRVRDQGDRQPLTLSCIVCLVGCGATESLAGMLLARFFLGVGGCMFRIVAVPVDENC